MSPRVMSGRSWSMALSMLAMRVMVRRRAAPLLCSTRRSDSRWMVRMVEIPKPTMRTITMSTVILMVREAAGSFMGARLRLSSGRGSNPDRAASPVGLAEHALEELARRVAREVLVKGDFAWVLVVLVEDVGETLDVELAGLAHGHGPAVVVEERDLPARGGLPARSGLPEDVLRSEDGVHRQLGRAVELVESRPEVGDHRLLDAHGTGRRGHDDGSHGGYVVAGPDGCGQLHDALEERGRHEGARAAMALDLLEGALGVELGHDHHRRPDQVRVQGKA